LFYQVEEYFGELPAKLVPVIGSAGERHRDRSLAQQLPKQDLALTYCRHVEPSQVACYEDFVHARNEIALDVGYAQEVAASDQVSVRPPNCLIKKFLAQKKGPNFGGAYLDDILMCWGKIQCMCTWKGTYTSRREDKLIGVDGRLGIEQGWWIAPISEDVRELQK